MGGKRSGRKFRWKAILIPKDSLVAIEQSKDYIKFSDSPEELFLKLFKMKRSEFYGIAKIEISRAKGKEEDEIKEMVRKRIKEAQR